MAPIAATAAMDASRTQRRGRLGARAACVLAAACLLDHLVGGSARAASAEGSPSARDAYFIGKLPGQPAQAHNHYSGYVSVNESAGRAFFFYFVEALSSPQSRPLTLWLNGGPGCSSLGYGAFSELGPFFPIHGGRNLVENEYTWAKYSNILFVESPAGVGFSYSNSTLDYDHAYANDFNTAFDNLAFLINWIKIFNEYKGRALYIAGESYAGHYVPQLANNVIEFMKENGTSLLNLKAIAIGNPLLDDLEDYRSRYSYLWAHGLNSYETIATIEKYCNWNTSNLSSTCELALSDSENEFGDSIDIYDAIEDVCLEKPIQSAIRKRLRLHLSKSSYKLDPCIDNKVVNYLNQHDVQVAMHANITSLPYPWSFCSSVLNYNEYDSPSTMTFVLKKILENDIRVLIYSGDQDTTLPLTGTEIVVNKLANLMRLKGNVYRNWFQGAQVGGWTIDYGNGELTFATIRGAAHFVPRTQGARALTLFKSFIDGVPLPPKAQG